ncbi:cyclic nucleotide-binding domain-containing protein [uncultured Erythrobacter sp.]|uniref:cyclic nucleotide-binding domain-containing protein n=1 Tax=uncultured Erythrobacter sp. TaxID=263913 RepID=UPI002620450F|nr:cyclic nucleotide-binding domain-containing protein [uncultured Erythrobacter sp.]
MSIFDPELLIYLGAGLLLIGYAIRDELKLRVLIAVSSFVYIAYYFAVGPLWGAIITSLLMIAVNFWVLGQIILERTTLRMSDDEKALYEAFETLTPGQFRRALKCADWITVSKAEGNLLTQENSPSNTLYYIFEGDAVVEKESQRFGLPAGNFVGEISFVLDSKASATVTAPPGVRYVAWDWDHLRKLSVKHPNLGNALNMRLTRDLAEKLTTSYRPGVPITSV